MAKKEDENNDLRILMEEIKEHALLKEEIKNGDTDIETTVDQIFMFNLHQDNLLLAVSASISDKLHEKKQKQALNEEFD